MFGYRTGAKQNHVNQIRERVLQGEGAEQISRALMIDLKCVQSFVHHFTKESKPKQEAATHEVETMAVDEPQTQETPKKRGRPRTQPRGSNSDD